MKAQHACLLAASITLSSTLSRADIGPLPGLKSVAYSFEVQNLDAFSGYALLAFPCGRSNGVPDRGFAPIENGKKNAVGKRGGPCTLYAMPKPAFDKWNAAHKSNDDKTFEAVEALFASTAVKKCSGSPTVTSVVDVGDPRSAVHEVLRATQIDATTCSISSTGGAAAAPSAPPSAPATATTAAPTAAATSPAPTPSASASAPPTPAKSGCGACEVGTASPSRVGLVLAALGLAGLLGRRGRRG